MNLRKKVERLLISKPTLVQYDCDVSDFADELITMILDEVNDIADELCDLGGDIPYCEFKPAIDNLRGENG